MPRWTNAPPETPDGPGLRIVRTPAASTLCAIATSPDVQGCPTHFFQRRTVPCEDSACEACAAGVGWRWHGWFGCILSGTLEHVLFEITAQAYEPLKPYIQQHGTLRGCQFTARRNSTRNNARVLISCKPADLAKIQLPPAPDVIRQLSHIWGIPYEQLTAAGHTYHRLARVTTNRKKPLTPTNSNAPEPSPPETP